MKRKGDHRGKWRSENKQVERMTEDERGEGRRRLLEDEREERKIKNSRWMKSNRKRDGKRREHLLVAGVEGREVARVKRAKTNKKKKQR